MVCTNFCTSFFVSIKDSTLGVTLLPKNFSEMGGGGGVWVCVCVCVCVCLRACVCVEGEWGQGLLKYNCLNVNLQ